MQKPYNLRKAAYIMQTLYNLRTPTAIAISKNKQGDFFLKRNGTQREGKSTQVNRDWKKSRKLKSLISFENLMVKELPLSVEDGDIPTNEDSTRIKQKIRILDHPKNLIEVLNARLAISQGLNGNNIKTGTNQYRFTRTFLNGEAFRIFDL